MAGEQLEEGGRELPKQFILGVVMKAVASHFQKPVGGRGKALRRQREGPPLGIGAWRYLAAVQKYL